VICLHCGDCCERMSPLSAPEPCPNIDRRGTFVFCDCYSRRPEECINHRFPSRYCPIGADLLGLDTEEKIAARIEAGKKERGTK